MSKFDRVFVPLFSPYALTGKFGIYIPPVIFDSELEEVKARLRESKEAGAKHALISNISHIPLAKELGFELLGDIRLNITNKYAKAAYFELGVSDSLLSAELTERGVGQIGGRVTLYGRIPLMLTERCYMRSGSCSGKCPEFSLVDRRGVHFPTIREFRHRNLVLNSAVTFMADKQAELLRLGINSGHFIFTTESAHEVSRVVCAYFEGGDYIPEKIRRIGVKAQNKCLK